MRSETAGAYAPAEQATGPPRSGGPGASHFRSRRRMARPTSPTPNTARVAGSGTAPADGLRMLGFPATENPDTLADTPVIGRTNVATPVVRSSDQSVLSLPKVDVGPAM